MKTKKKVLIGLMALCLAGTAGAAFAAITSVSANKTATGNIDSAIYLYWGAGETEATIANVENLTAGTAQYRYLTVAPRATQTVAGTVTLTFTIDCEENYSVDGLTFKVYETATLVNDSGVAAAISGQTAKVTLTSETSGTTTFAVSAGVETTKYYALSFEYDGSQQAAGYTFGGKMTIGQSFSAS